MVIQVQHIPLLYLLFDISIIHPLHLGSLIFASAFVVGLVGRKRSIDVVLVCVFILAVIGGLFATNDLEVIRALMESQQG